MSLNVNKSNHILFQTANCKVLPNINLKLRGKIVKKVSSAKFLGVTINEHLSWKAHMESVMQKIRINLGAVKKISCLLNQKSLMMLYDSLIKSHLSYCISSWCFGNKTLIQKIQCSVNKFIRLIFGLHYKSSVKNIMKENNIMSLVQLQHIETTCYIYQYLNNQLLNALMCEFD